MCLRLGTWRVTLGHLARKHSYERVARRDAVTGATEERGGETDHAVFGAPSLMQVTSAHVPTLQIYLYITYSKHVPGFGPEAERLTM